MKNICSAVMSIVAGLAAAGLSPGVVRADGPTFTILNQSNLGDSQAEFFILGTAQIGSDFAILKKAEILDASTGPSDSVFFWMKAKDDQYSPENPDGSWNAGSWNVNSKSFSGAGVVPCYKIKGGEKLSIPSNIASGRIFIFQAMSGTAFFKNKPCLVQPNKNPTEQVAYGIFGTKSTDRDSLIPFSFTSTAVNGNAVGISPDMVALGVMPLYSFAETTGGATGATIDASQVDLIAFPLTITAYQTAASSSQSNPTWDKGVGFSFSPNGEINMQSVLASYKEFYKSLSDQRDKANFGKLIIPVQGSNPPTSILVNPGKFLSFPSTVGFSGYFNKLITGYLWNGKWNGIVDAGGTYGFPSDLKLSAQAGTFAGNSPSIKGSIYPGYQGKTPLAVIQFTMMLPGTQDQVVAYLLSPTSYQHLCRRNVIAGCASQSPAEQVFGQQGALAGPPDNNQFGMLSTAQQKVWTDYAVGATTEKRHENAIANYNALVARLGLIFSNAMNRGVAGGLSKTGGLCDKAKYPQITQCWSDQTNWYPWKIKGKNIKVLFYKGDITQNHYARWLHTAAVPKTGGIPIMAQPTGPTTTMSGSVMGMAYGFAFDEDPTPSNPVPQFPASSKTPSEFNGTVSPVLPANLSPGGGCNYIVIMPWTGPKSNVSPVDPACENVTKPD